MNEEAEQSDDVLSDAAIAHIREKVAEALEIGFAEITLVIEKHRLAWIRGPSPSERIRG